MSRLAVVLILFLAVAVCAQEELDDNRQVLKRPDVNAAMSEVVYNRLSAIHEMMGEDRFDEALQGLQRLDGQRLSKYEEALVKQTFGFVYAQQDKTTEAIRSFEESLATGSLPPQAHQGLLYSLAGLYMSEKQYMKAITTMREWFRYEPDPVPDAYIVIGSSFAQLERYADALPYVLKAIAKADGPRENWYMLALAIYFDQEQYRDAAAMLVKMLGFWPDKPRYWDMLSGCYLELGDDGRALDTMMVAYSNGMLTSPQNLRSLAQLNIARDIPYTAGVILQAEIDKGTVEANEDNLELLLQAWLAAREYDSAVNVINRLSQYADDGEYFLQAAQIYNEKGEWEKVIENADKALAAGLDNPVDAHMLSGVAFAELDRIGEAEEVFRRVTAVGDRDERRNAESWLAFLDEKREVRALTRE